MDQKVEFNKEEIPGSMWSMHGYILTYSRFLKGKTLTVYCSLIPLRINSNPLRWIEKIQFYKRDPPHHLNKAANAVKGSMNPLPHICFSGVLRFLG